VSLYNNPMLQPLRQLVDATDDYYPLPIHLSHALFSQAMFREWRGPSEAPYEYSWLHSLVASYFCMGNAGSSGADALLAKPGEADGLVRNKDVAVGWLLAHLAVNWAPEDFVYKTLTSKGNPIRVAMRLMDSIDATTTICQRVDKAMLLRPESVMTPLLAGMMVTTTGSLFRYLEAKGRGSEDKVWWANPTGGVRNGFVCTMAYYLIGKLRANGTSALAVRFVLVLVFLAVELMEEFGVCEDPIKPLFDLASKIGWAIALKLRLGRASHPAVALKRDMDNVREMGSDHR